MIDKPDHRPHILLKRDRIQDYRLLTRQEMGEEKILTSTEKQIFGNSRGLT
jgi:hypothetical protein